MNITRDDLPGEPACVTGEGRPFLPSPGTALWQCLLEKGRVSGAQQASAGRGQRAGQEPLGRRLKGTDFSLAEEELLRGKSYIREAGVALGDEEALNWEDS